MSLIAAALVLLRRWYNIKDKDAALFGSVPSSFPPVSNSKFPNPTPTPTPTPRSLPIPWCHAIRGNRLAKQLICKLGYLGGFLVLLFRRPSRLVRFVAPHHQVVAGLPYGAPGNTDTTLDVYAPPHAARLPVCIFVHGGVWTFGSRFLYRLLGERFAEDPTALKMSDY